MPQPIRFDPVDFQDHPRFKNLRWGTERIQNRLCWEGECRGCGATVAGRSSGFRKNHVSCRKCSLHALTAVDPSTQVGTCSVCGPGVGAYRTGRWWGCKIAASEGRLRREYGMDRGGWEALVMAQVGRDPITLLELSDPVVDHCEACGTVRGLLHRLTNQHLGQLFHSSVAFQALAFDLARRPHLTADTALSISTPDRARAAAAYLEAHHQQCPATRRQNDGPHDS